ncbi:MAG: hypothetical protein JOZ05_19275, partial [Acetobacteraceae bacterium]|nr:hypothetical protein [Acetobacteraceae bacterium]
MPDPRAALLTKLRGGDGRIAETCTPRTVWHVAHPVNDLKGIREVLDGFLLPLSAALPRHLRRDDLVLGGRSRVSQGYWVATLGQYVGNFERPLWGIRPHGKLVFLR